MFGNGVVFFVFIKPAKQVKLISHVYKLLDDIACVHICESQNVCLNTTNRNQFRNDLAYRICRLRTYLYIFESRIRAIGEYRNRFITFFFFRKSRHHEFVKGERRAKKHQYFVTFFGKCWNGFFRFRDRVLDIFFFVMSQLL